MIAFKIIRRLSGSTRFSTVRSFSTVGPQISFREQSWRDVQENYAKYQYIVYSSYLEKERHVNLGFKKRKIVEKSQSNIDISKLTDLLDLKEEKPKESQVQNASFPKNWMDDYEFYAGGTENDSTVNSMFGTADETIPPSKVPCNGCGAHLHCTKTSLPGYIPMEIFKGRTEEELKTIICQRCHFLKNYNIALDVEVSAEFYENTIARIEDKFALAVVIVDLLDMPCSLWPNMPKLLGQKRPVFILGNKVDLLPRDSNGYLERVMECLKAQVFQSGFEPLNVKYFGVISAKTGYGIEEFITKLHKVWLYKGDVYLLGCTNVGKSSLFNILLNSDYCRPEASSLVRRATTCPWPGTTLQMLKFPILRPSDYRIQLRAKRLFSERAKKAAEDKLRRDQARIYGSIRSAELVGNVGRTFVREEDTLDAFTMARGSKPVLTLNERSKDYKQSKWCFDTPGVLHPDQFTNLLTTDELRELEPTCMISPRALRLKPNQSLFLGGLARLDLIHYSKSQYDWIKIFIFLSMNVPLTIATTEDAERMYTKYIGSEILGYPFGSEERLNQWPGLKCTNKEICVGGTNSPTLTCDIVFSSIGWIGLDVPAGSECIFKTWTPNGRGVYMRVPPLVAHASRLIGKRIANSVAYNVAKPFVFNK